MCTFQFLVINNINTNINRFSLNVHFLIYCDYIALKYYMSIYIFSKHNTDTIWFMNLFSGTLDDVPSASTEPTSQCECEKLFKTFPNSIFLSWRHRLHPSGVCNCLPNCMHIWYKHWVGGWGMGKYGLCACNNMENFTISSSVSCVAHNILIIWVGLVWKR